MIESPVFGSSLSDSLPIALPSIQLLFPVILLFFSNEKTINSVEKKITLIFFIILLQNIQIDFNGRFNITRIFVDVITLLFFIYQTINITINSFKMKSTGEKKCQ